MGRPGKRPRGWTKCPKLREAYEEGGAPVGRLMVWQPEEAEKLWKMLGPVMGWPKWYLEVFRFHWIKDNPAEYQRYRTEKMQGKARKRKTAARLKEAQQQAQEAVERGGQKRDRKC